MNIIKLALCPDCGFKPIVELVSPFTYAIYCPRGCSNLTIGKTIEKVNSKGGNK